MHQLNNLNKNINVIFNKYRISDKYINESKLICNISNKLINDINKCVKAYTEKIICEMDRHREGYYQEYAEKTGKKDRHSPDYYKKYRERKKQEALINSQVEPDKDVVSAETTKSNIINKKPKDRRAYYRKYNQAHPERLNRGFTKGYINGNIDDGLENEIFPGVRILGYDEFGLPVTNNPFGDMIRNHEMTWHDDDWYEDPD